MIPGSFIESWGQHVPWKTLAMVEQDLIISRALVDLFNHQVIKNSLVFRGGTALNKIYLKPPARYSEDIDFVQMRAEPIGPVIDAIRTALGSWLGEPKRKQTERGVKLIYRYVAIDGTPAKLKLEINTAEHFQVLDLQYVEHNVASEWFSGQSTIVTYCLAELMGTKLRALYQRRKGRDLFDVWFVCHRNLVNIDQMIEIYHQYCAHDGLIISQDAFMKNLGEKRLNTDFQIDMHPLLPNSIDWNFDTTFEFVQNNIVTKFTDANSEKLKRK